MDIGSLITGAIVTVAGNALIKGDIYKYMSQMISVASEETATITRDSFKYFNAVRVAKVFIKVCSILKENDIDNAETITNKILFPAIEHISIDDELENNESLQDLWANLLAEKASGNSIPLDYFDIIKKLDTEDVKALENLFNRELNCKKYKKQTTSKTYLLEDNTARIGMPKTILRNSIPKGALKSTEALPIIIKESNNKQTISGIRLEEACLLEELGYSSDIRIPARIEILKKYGLVESDLGIKNEERIYLTILGIDFMETTTGIRVPIEKSEQI